MATIVNTTPAVSRDEGSGMVMVVGLILLFVLLFLFFVYGLPLLRQSTNAPQINVPGKIDVNLNQSK